VHGRACTQQARLTEFLAGSMHSSYCILLQGGLGEASCLALTSYYSGRPAITLWSSGTGFAGVFGYAWVALLHMAGE